MSDNQPNNSLSSEDVTTPADLVPTPEASMSPVESVPEPKAKKKKKKKKSATKTSSKTVFYGPSGEVLSAPKAPQAEPLTNPNSSPLEAPTAIPQTVLTLPVKPDEWFISPAIYDRDGDLLVEETFTYLKDGIEIISLPFNQNNFEGLTQLLAERFTPPETNTEADFFHIRKPLSDSDEADPVMTLTQKNRILATTSLDQKTLKQLIKALQKHVEKPTTITAWLNRWWGKHKIWRVILTIAALPLVLFLLYSIFWGATH
jgi:hypothetical protein